MQPGNALTLGRIVNGSGELTLAPDQRDKHLYICGATGVGKSKFIEHLIRQDIENQRQSGCGLLLLDPHGELYDNLMVWLATHRINRPIIPIDLRRDDWVVAYNVLRQRATAKASVIVDNLVDAVAHVWGQTGTDQTPLFARWLSAILHALYEKGHTLMESVYLTDRVEKTLREALTAGLTDPVTRREWAFANSLRVTDFEQQMGSTINRLQRFVRNDTIRTILGQTEVSLDLGRALEEGHIILVNLATEGGCVSSENARLFATLLLTDLWTAAQERGKRKGIKPFYVYLDEFQRFITPTIAENLDEARGFGLHLTMAHQYPGQLTDAGEHGVRLWHSIMENASSKVIFRLSHEDNLKPLAQWLFMGVMDPDEIKHQLFSTKVMDYRVEYQKAYSHGSTASSGRSSTHGTSSGTGSGESKSFRADDLEELTDTESWNEHFAESAAESQSWSHSESSSVSETPMLMPVLGKEISHVQFATLEEQLFRGMAALFDQKQRQAVVRLVGMKAPVSIFTPVVEEGIARPERVRQYTQSLLERWPFALPAAEALKRLTDRQKYFEQDFLRDALAAVADEPTTSKRRVSEPEPDKTASRETETPGGKKRIPPKNTTKRFKPPPPDPTDEPGTSKRRIR